MFRKSFTSNLSNAFVTFSTIIAVLLVSLCVVGGLTGCSTKESTDGKQTGGDGNEPRAEIAVCPDVGGINDKSFNQGAWEGACCYAQENGLSYNYYKPVSNATGALVNSIVNAINGGAKIVVCPGFNYQIAVWKMQTEYPDVKFVLIDSVPMDEQGNAKICKNTVAVSYTEEEAGFLAGYATVYEGYKNLGFMGGVAIPAVERFGYGYIQGAEYAAAEAGLPNESVNMRYTYVGNYDATPDNMSKAAAWFNSGTDVIFACGGAMGNSVMKAAMFVDKHVVGVDVDQSGESETVITSAQKNLSDSVYKILELAYQGKYPGGESLNLSIADDGVGLPMETSRFTKFDKKIYDMVCKKIIQREIKLLDDKSVNDATEIQTAKVKLEYIY